MKPSHDVIVVGGGVFGSAVAFELAKRSVRVLLIDQSLPGRATSASAGGLWPVGEVVGLGCGIIYHAAQRDGPYEVSVPDVLPQVFRDFLVESNRLFPSVAQELQDVSAVDVEYAPGGGLIFLMYTLQDQAIVDAVARTLPDKGILELLTPDEVFELEPSITRNVIGGARLAEEHQVNPMLLAEAFKRAAVAKGATLRHGTQVSRLQRCGDRIEGVLVDEEFLAAPMTVNAAGAWAASLAATAGIELPIEPVRGQVVLTETLPQVLGTCVSTVNCYLMQKSHGEVLIGSTTERVGFDVSVTEQAISTLCAGAAKAVPMLRDANIKRVWAGLRPGTPDELPILGPVEGIEGIVNAAGGFRTGIVASALVARVIAQHIIGEEPAFNIDPFLASRFVAQAA